VTAGTGTRCHALARGAGGGRKLDVSTGFLDDVRTRRDRGGGIVSLLKSCYLPDCQIVASSLGDVTWGMTMPSRPAIMAKYRVCTAMHTLRSTNSM
jgi:hypothetical protein